MKIGFGNGFKTTEKKSVCLALEKACDILGQPNKLEVSVSLVCDEEIRKINKQFRSKDAVTDVLSFPSLNLKAGEKINIETNKHLQMTKGYLFLGDVILAKGIVEKQAAEFKHSFADEMVRLVVHSFLHLLGFDHIKDEDFEIMRKFEEKIISDIK